MNTTNSTTNAQADDDRSAHIGLIVPLELKARLKARAQADDLTVSSLLRRAARAWLETDSES